MEASHEAGGPAPLTLFGKLAAWRWRAQGTTREMRSAATRGPTPSPQPHEARSFGLQTFPTLSHTPTYHMPLLKDLYEGLAVDTPDPTSTPPTHELRNPETKPNPTTSDALGLQTYPALGHMPLGHMPLGHMPLGHMPLGHMPLGHMPSPGTSPPSDRQGSWSPGTPDR